MRKYWTLAGFGAVLSLGACMKNGAPAPVMGGDAYIIDAASGGIADYHVENERTVYLRDRANRWYRVELASDCPGLRFNPTIHFSTDPLGRFDRFSHITTREARCAVHSIQYTAPPADKGGSARG